jgi:hypothetical protein
LRKILLLVGFAPTVLMIAALAAWRLWPSAPPADAQTFEIAGQRLRFGPTYIRAGETSEPDRIDLVVHAPDFAPAASTPIRLPASGERDDKGRGQIFVTLTPAPKLDGRAASAAPGELYGPYVAPEVQISEGGLLRRRFEDNSPYAGEDLLLAPPDGEEFFARCPRPKIPTDGLPDFCLSEYRIDGLLAQMRFDPVWLGEWRALRANLQQLVRTAKMP